MKSDPEPAPQGFERRAARAEALAPTSEAAEEPLRFAAGLYRAQAAMAASLDGRPLTGRLATDLPELAGGMKQVLAYVAARGPSVLAATAGGLPVEEGLEAFWRGSRSGTDDYLARARLRPWVVVLAMRGVAPEPGAGEADATARCRHCGGLAWIGVRRPAESSGDASHRMLGCALCGREQPVGRIVCPACGEGKPEALPIFQSDRHPGARVEACNACRHYLKSVDLTVDARAIPEVDDLLSLSLDLWAREQGFARIEPGLAGI